MENYNEKIRQMFMKNFMEFDGKFNELTERFSPGNPYTAHTPKQYTLLKKSQGTLCPAGSVSGVQPSCCFLLVHQSPSFNRVKK
jgi:hypothetical protein